MSERKEYRSAIRSRKLIRRAFLELLKEKSFEKITVTDIVKRAEINRSTFYAHYPDVMGVIEEVEEEVLKYFEDYMAKMDLSDFFQNPKPHLQSIVWIAEENRELYRLLSNSNIAVRQLEHLKTILIERILDSIKMPDFYKKNFEFQFSVRFFMGGFVDVYTQWLNEEMECSLDDMVDETTKLLIRVYESYGDMFDETREDKRIYK